ncbi:MAG TPA: transglutaminase-like cysteine peptidase [Pseudolabrys sp.]|jgi:predicted transglutaminase-like cysteine proteinase|nr:transglutaminase-like cysteine peptidase [Pseudolabrys sp.]
MIRTKIPSPPPWKSRTWRCSIALLLLGLTAQAKADKSLDFAALEAPNGANSAMWKELKSAIEEEREVITRCRSDPVTCSPSAARRFVAIVDEGTGYEGRARIGHINRAANLAIRATRKYLEKWTSPLETLAKGVGDCKQYAVLKYVALNEAGYDVDRLRIVVVKDKMMRWSHAVVAVRSGEQWIVLDNRSYALVESSEFLKGYTPVAILPQLLQRESRTAEHKTH